MATGTHQVAILTGEAGRRLEAWTMRHQWIARLVIWGATLEVVALFVTDPVQLGKRAYECLAALGLL